ncbi:amino acid ABC transporter permease [Falseniella ignava]|nr:amino acid ABC transporter permease [Falseniella ignava]
MDIELIKVYFFNILKGTQITIFLAIISLVISLVLGILFGFIKFYRIPILNPFLKIYTSFFRGTPAMAQILLVYFVIFGMNDFTSKLRPEYAAVTTLSLNAAAYLSETFLGAFNSVSKGQIDAGLSVGMTNIKIMEKIIFPQAMEAALPSLLNTLIDLIKGTSIAFMIGVPEMMAVASFEGSRRFDYGIIYIIVSAIYWALSLILTNFQRHVSKKRKLIHVRRVK